MSDFIPRQITHRYTQRLAGTPEQILPLLTPEGERAWAEGWDPTILLATPQRDGSVFLTRSPVDPETLWLLYRYDPIRHYVHYYRITPGSNVTELDVELRAASPNLTEATVRYTYTGLSERGNAFVATRTEAYYLDFMTSWEAQLNHYLTSRAT